MVAARGASEVQICVIETAWESAKRHALPHIEIRSTGRMKQNNYKEEEVAPSAVQKKKKNQGS